MGWLPMSSPGRTRALGCGPREGEVESTIGSNKDSHKGRFDLHGGQPYTACYGWVYAPNFRYFSLSRSSLMGSATRVCTGGKLSIYMTCIQETRYA